ncbi:FcoT family thioesterase [Nocardia carnea]|uniref:FcoT family thioesterase n=1 Tax=Nocardia carnea TaxID=37328 RepID=UPI002455A9E6|nr:FcoT family thioesterase [Nocardia carnea]
MTATDSAPAVAVSDATADDIALLTRAMRPYARTDTVYLKRAHAARRGESVVGVGEFAIDRSCYIADTGHFNAVEFTISYNQLFYYTMAVAIRDRLIPELADWSMDDYWARQLPSVLISRFGSRYRRPIDSRWYTAELTVREVSFRNRSRPLYALRTGVEFADAAGGSAVGDIEIVLVDPPGHPAAGSAR